MRRLIESWHRILALFRRRQLERDFEDELQFHLEAKARDSEHADSLAAAAAARRHFGRPLAAKEGMRDAWTFVLLDDLFQDVKYAVRGLRRSPGYSLAAAITLALGIGLSTAIVSIVNTILISPLPYRDSDRLVQIAENIASDAPDGRRFTRRFGLTQAEFLEWRTRTTTLSQMAGVINLMNGTVQTSEGSVSAPRAIVSPSLFDMLGVRAQIGRTLHASDERPGADAAVMSADAWSRLYSSDPTVLGRRVTLNGTAFTIVGVMPAGFDYPERSTMFWTVLAPRPGPGGNVFGTAIGKLKDGVSLSAATDEANVLGAALRKPPTMGYGTAGPPPPPPPATATMGGAPRLDLTGRPRFEALGVKDLLVADIRSQLRVLAAAVLVVLLIGCANVASLMLARGTARQREIGVRVALGAARSRIVRQLITECAVLSLAAALGGITIAIAAVRLVKVLATVETPRLFQLSINLGDGSLLPRVNELGMDATLIIMALGIAMIASLLSGLAPAVYLSRTRIVSAMRIGNVRSEGAYAAAGRVRNVFVVAEVVMATALLIGGGLLVQSFMKLQTVNPGYDARDVLTFQLVVRPQTTGEQQMSAIERVIARLRADPRVVSIGYTNIPPFLSLTEYGGLVVPPGTTREAMLDDPLRPQTRVVNAAYLQTLGTRLLAGRWLNAGDGASAPLSFVVNCALVQRYFGGASPVGSLVRVYRSPDYIEDWRIVGVVEDIAQARLDQDPFPIVFADMRQVLAARERMPKSLQVGQGLPGFPTIVLRGRGPIDALAASVRGMVRQIDPDLSVDSIADLEALRFGSLVRPRFYATLVGACASIAVILAAIGIYAVLAYAVAQRTHEIGVRMALGARRGAVLRNVLIRGMATATFGVAGGVLVAAVSTRYLSTMLYGLTPLDTTTYAAVALVILGIAGLACYVPARRATQVDPLIALRTE